ncbi:hypothetical protein [Brevibacterium aurantiacum]|uniref:Uncharacterized protein n=1 Tax=Brevibacterium aurantiacum TaxID=273384 RepID=A0A556CCR3_BREAU|nr:hypothetical protein [Brevibacterium aurantiacum]TSI15086.1 hypothetical protein FO013_13765 [Brevibacterium aurantiacum]
MTKGNTNMPMSGTTSPKVRTISSGVGRSTRPTTSARPEIPKMAMLSTVTMLRGMGGSSRAMSMAAAPAAQARMNMAIPVGRLWAK